MNPSNSVIHITKPDIFSFEECLHFLDRGYDDCLYSVEEDRVIKPLHLDGQQMLVEVTDDADALKVEILAGEVSQRTLENVAGYVTEWFDLERDLQSFYQLLKKDEHLSWMTKQFFGLRLMGIPDLFEALCWCVIGQQINLTFAHRLKRRLVETYGTFVEYNSKRHYYFPEAEILATLDIDDLKNLQFSRQKAEYITGIASAFANGNLSKSDLAEYEESEMMLKRLMKIRGIGEWTANYVLMKSLKKIDCITHGDTGLQSAVSAILGLERKPTREEIETFFNPFAGWESYMNIYLWRSLS